MHYTYFSLYSEKYCHLVVLYGSKTYLRELFIEEHTSTLKPVVQCFSVQQLVE